MRVAAGFAWGERGGGCAGVVGLAWPLFRVGAQHRGQPRACFRLADRVGRGRRQRRGVLPLGQALPDPQRLTGWGRIRLAQRRCDEWRPAPAGLAHACGQPGGVAVQRDLAALRKAVEQGGGEFRQQGCLCLQVPGRRLEIQHQRQAARRRGRRAAGQSEGEQLEQVERRHGAEAKTPECGRGVHQDRRRQAAEPAGGFGGGQQQQLAVGREDGGAAVSGNDSRRIRQRNSRHVRSLDAIGTPRHCGCCNIREHRPWCTGATLPCLGREGWGGGHEPPIGDHGNSRRRNASVRSTHHPGRGCRMIRTIRVAVVAVACIAWLSACTATAPGTAATQNAEMNRSGGDGGGGGGY